MVETACRSYPQSVFPVADKDFYIVVAYRESVLDIVSEDFEFLSVVSVQTIPRAEPHISVTVLNNRYD